MKSNHLLVAAASLATLSACNNTGDSKNTANYKDVNNPFFKESPLQYHAPEFDKIKSEHFKPAFDTGMVQQNAEIEKIINNKEAASFENTVVALETSGEILKRHRLYFTTLLLLIKTVPSLN